MLDQNIHHQPGRTSDAGQPRPERRSTAVTIGVIEQVSSNTKRNVARLRNLILVALGLSAIVGGCFLLSSFQSESAGDHNYGVLVPQKPKAKSKVPRDSSSFDSEDDVARVERDWDMEDRFESAVAAETEKNLKLCWELYLKIFDSLDGSRIDWDARLTGSWVGEMKKSMENHSNKLLKMIYKRFEKKTSAEIAMFMYASVNFREWMDSNKATNREHFRGVSDTKPGDLTIAQVLAEQRQRVVRNLQSMTKAFARRMYFYIIRDEAMRKYLGYRGLRRRLYGAGSGWGTVAIDFTLGRNEPNFMFIADQAQRKYLLSDHDDGIAKCMFIQHYSTKESGTQKSTVDTTLSDSDGKGSHSFSKDANGRKDVMKAAFGIADTVAVLRILKSRRIQRS